MLIEQIKSTKSNQGKSQMTSGNKYQVRLSYNGKSISMVFNDNYLNKSTTKDFLWALMIDAQSYENNPFYMDFCKEFGYDDVYECKAKKAFKGCQNASIKIHKLFTEEEIEQLYNEFYEIGY